MPRPGLVASDELEGGASNLLELGLFFDNCFFFWTSEAAAAAEEVLEATASLRALVCANARAKRGRRVALGMMRRGFVRPP
jgi:hypothetical protein